MNPMLTTLIVNPSEPAAITMNLYCEYTGFLKPIQFTTPTAYQEARAYAEDSLNQIDIAVIDFTDLKQGLNLFSYLSQHSPSTLLILLADQSQLSEFSDIVKSSNALIVLKPSKFSFIIDWIRTHFSNVCRAESRDMCPYLVSVEDKRAMPYTSMICSTCKFNY